MKTLQIGMARHTNGVAGNTSLEEFLWKNILVHRNRKSTVEFKFYL